MTVKLDPIAVSDLPTVVRDHISEAHFMQADGRLVVERMRQIPEYERRFEEAFYIASLVGEEGAGERTWRVEAPSE